MPQPATTRHIALLEAASALAVRDDFPLVASPGDFQHRHILNHRNTDCRAFDPVAADGA
jgi:hypothetical protein